MLIPKPIPCTLLNYSLLKAKIDRGLIFPTPLPQHRPCFLPRLNIHVIDHHYKQPLPVYPFSVPYPLSLITLTPFGVQK